MNGKKKITFKRGLILLLITLLLLTGVLSWNYLTFSSRQLNVLSVSLLKSDDSQLILARFVEAIKIQTDSTAMSRIAIDSALYRFRNQIQTSFPQLHTPPFERRTGKDFGDEANPSILFQWPGQEPELGAILLMSHFDVVPIGNRSRVGF